MNCNWGHSNKITAHSVNVITVLNASFCVVIRVFELASDILAWPMAYV